ncbi:MAG: hypothetical protein K6G45_09880 [Lachnospiraceae bacterium]|nr:hypothetical protein [Lachnospiraceae bacterium]
MAQFDFVVDTSPMAESVNSVSNHVDATTSAVVAMQSAVIASEQKAAENICENVDRGFYNLIRSQVSMKLATYSTEMHAKLSLLLEFTKALNMTEQRMEADYNRIRRDYLKIFKGLDKALENRISQLDRDAVKLAGLKKDVVFRHFIKDVPKTKASINEVTNTGQLAITARLKSKTSKALDSLGSKVRENYNYVDKMDSVMEEKSTDEQFEEYIPVVYVREQSMVMEDSYVTKINIPDYLKDSTKNTIEMSIMGQINNLLETQKNEEETMEIRREFQNMVTSSSLNPQVANLMMRLFQNGGC